MMPNKDTLLMEISADGTEGISFHATAEHGNFVEMEEIEDSGEQHFTQNDFERPLKKASRRQNIPIGENIRDAIRSIKGQ
jgi:hypothetical protein